MRATDWRLGGFFPRCRRPAATEFHLRSCVNGCQKTPCPNSSHFGLSIGKARARPPALKLAKPEIPEATHDVGFPIPEDDILAVSQRLMFCGRQKDVAELRSWLRQFDDEARIKVAFLLLKRLTEKGFINEGSKSLALGKLNEIVGLDASRWVAAPGKSSAAVLTTCA